MAIVYQHRRNDTNEIFYIGIGKEEKRAYDKFERSYFWKRIVNKTDYVIEILFDNVTWEEACEVERYLIKYYGRRDLKTGKLVNMTDGGDGNTGPKTDEFKNKCSNRMKNNTINNGRKHSNDINQKKGRKGSLNKLHGKPRLGGGGKPKKIVLDFETGIFYESLVEAAEYNNIKYSTLANMLNGNNSNKTTLKYV